MLKSMPTYCMTQPGLPLFSVPFPSVRQPPIFRLITTPVAKGGLSACDLRPFALQFVAFCAAIHGLSHDILRHIATCNANSLKINGLSEFIIYICSVGTTLTTKNKRTMAKKTDTEERPPSARRSRTAGVEESAYVEQINELLLVHNKDT